MSQNGSKYLVANEFRCPTADSFLQGLVRELQQILCVDASYIFASPGLFSNCIHFIQALKGIRKEKQAKKKQQQKKEDQQQSEKEKQAKYCSVGLPTGTETSRLVENCEAGYNHRCLMLILRLGLVVCVYLLNLVRSQIFYL